MFCPTALKNGDAWAGGGKKKLRVRGPDSGQNQSACAPQTPLMAKTLDQGQNQCRIFDVNRQATWGMSGWNSNKGSGRYPVNDAALVEKGACDAFPTGAHCKCPVPFPNTRSTCFAVHRFARALSNDITSPVPAKLARAVRGIRHSGTLSKNSLMDW